MKEVRRGKFLVANAVNHFQDVRIHHPKPLAAVELTQKTHNSALRIKSAVLDASMHNEPMNLKDTFCILHNSPPTEHGQNSLSIALFARTRCCYLGCLHDFSYIHRNQHHHHNHHHPRLQTGTPVNRFSHPSKLFGEASWLLLPFGDGWSEETFLFRVSIYTFQGQWVSCAGGQWIEHKKFILFFLTNRIKMQLAVGCDLNRWNLFRGCSFGLHNSREKKLWNFFSTKSCRGSCATNISIKWEMKWPDDKNAKQPTWQQKNSLEPQTLLEKIRILIII